MSDTSAINKALNEIRNGARNDWGEGDTRAINQALGDVQRAALDQIYNLPYPEAPKAPTYTPSPPPSAVQPSVPPAATAVPSAPALTTYKPTALTNNPPASVGGIMGALQSAAQGVMDSFQQVFTQGTPTTLPNGTPDSIAQSIASGNPFSPERSQRFLADIGGVVNGLNDVTNLIPGAEPVKQAVADVAGAANENVLNPIAGLGGAATGNILNFKPFGGESIWTAAMGPNNPVDQALAPVKSALQSAVDATTFTLPDGKSTYQLQGDEEARHAARMTQSYDQLNKGDFAGATQTLLQDLRDTGTDFYNHLTPVDALVAGLIFDPLNFVPGLGLGEKARDAKVIAATKSVERITEADKLLDKSRLLTPMSKVVETVKGGFDNLIGRTFNELDPDTYFDTLRAFATGADSPEAYAKAIAEVAGIDSYQGQRAMNLLKEFAPAVDELQDAHRTVEAALKTPNMLSDAQISKLPAAYRDFVDAVKAGKAAPEELLDVTKAVTAQKAQAHMAETARKLFPLSKPGGLVGVGDRALSELRSLEAILYIGLSPVTWVRNWINNKATGILEGVSPLWDFEQEAKYLARHGRLDYANELRRARTAHELMSGAGKTSSAGKLLGGQEVLGTSATVRRAFGDTSQMAGGVAATNFSGWMGKLAQKTPMLKWYSKIENAEKARVWAHGYWRAMQNFDKGKWIPELSAEAQAMLTQYRVNPDDLYGVLRDVAMQGGKKSDYVRAVNEFLNGQRSSVDMAALAERLSAKWGVPVSEQEVRAFMLNGDEARLADLQQSILERVQQGEPAAQAVTEEVAQAAADVRDGLATKLGTTTPTMRLQELEQRLAEIDDAQAALLKNGRVPKVNRKAWDALDGERTALDDELTAIQEQLGYTDEEILFGRQTDVPSAQTDRGTVETPPLAPEPTPTVDELPEPLYDEQALTAGQQQARQYLLSLKRADGTPVYTEEQLRAWKPDTLERIAGEVQSTRATFDDVVRTARDKGIATATEKGAPNNRHLLNTLNKHKAPDAPRFVTMDDVRARADEARQILDNYGLEARPQTPRVISFDEFAAERGYEKVPFAEDVHRQPRATKTSRKRASQEVIRRNEENTAILEQARKDYDAMVARGEIRPPTSAEKLQETATRNPDTAQAQAAQRVLERRKAAAPKPIAPKPVEPFTLEERRAFREESVSLQSRLFKKDGTPKVKQNPDDLARWEELQQKANQWQDYVKANEKFLASERQAAIAREYGLTFDAPAEIEWGGTVGTVRGNLNYSGGDVLIGNNVIPKSRWGEITQTGTPPTPSGRVADRIPPGEILTPEEDARRTQVILDEIRRMATPDPEAVRILSQDEVAKAHARFQAEVLQELHDLWQSEPMRTYRLGTDAQNRVNQWLRRDVLPAWDDAHVAATMHANDLVDKVLLNTDRRTTVDALASIIMPFSFWRFHYGAETVRRVFDHPWMLAAYLNLRDGLDSVQNDPAYPERLRGMFEFPLPPFLPKWMGGKGYFKPLEELFPVEQTFGLNRFQDGGVSDEDVSRQLYAKVKSGEISTADAANAIANGDKSALWAQTKQELEEFAQPGDGLSDLFRPHLPLDVTWKLLTGRGKELGPLIPLTRLIRAGSNMVGQDVNIEAPVKAGIRALQEPIGQAGKALGLNKGALSDVPDWDAWEQYRIDREVANLVGEGGASARDGLLALIERRGTVYEEAKARVRQTNTTRTIASFGLQGMDLFPQGEREYYRGVIERDRLLDEAVASLGGNPETMSSSEKWEVVKANGLTAKGTPLGDVYDRFPALGARTDLHDQPETRLKSYLTDELWDKYNNLSALDKRLVSDQLGDAFKEAFRNRETRDYSKISLDQAATWVKQMRGYVPQQEIAKAGDAPEVKYATPEQSQRYAAFQEQRDRLFDMDVLGPKLDAYNQIPKDDTARRRLARAADPMVAAYLSFYGNWMDANPDIAALINPDAQKYLASAVNSRSVENSVNKMAISALERLAYQIGGRNRPGAGGRTAAATAQLDMKLLTPQIRSELARRKANPRYRISDGVFAQLLNLYRKYRMGARSFNDWLVLVLGSI